MKKLTLLVLSIAFLMSCTSRGPAPDQQKEDPAQAQPVAQAKTIPDSKIGLAAGTAFEQPTQDPIAYNTADPGESELVARPSGDFPPVIPHSIEDLEAISRTENACLVCHDAAAASDFGATAIPDSHSVDLRRKPDQQADEVVGARWVCTSCHVERTMKTPA